MFLGSEIAFVHPQFGQFTLPTELCHEIRKRIGIVIRNNCSLLAEQVKARDQDLTLEACEQYVLGAAAEVEEGHNIDGIGLRAYANLLGINIVQLFSTHNYNVSGLSANDFNSQSNIMNKESVKVFCSDLSTRAPAATCEGDPCLHFENFDLFWASY